MATRSSILGWEIPDKNTHQIYSFICLPMDGGAGWAAVPGVSKSQTRVHFHFSLLCIGEGNGNPLQGSCLENPRDSGAWWAAVYGVAQSWTRLKRRSSSTTLFPGGAVVKNPPANTGDAEMWIRSLG